GKRNILHLPLIECLHGGKAGGGSGLRSGRGTGWLGHLRRSFTELAWAGSPSASARATAAGPIAWSAEGSREMKLVRFMKSSTDSPLAKRARRPVGRTWFGPAT